MKSIVSFVGAESCGKTCVIKRYMTKENEQFNLLSAYTIYESHSLPELEIRDIGGAEKYESQTPYYCSNTDRVIYCVALNDTLDSAVIIDKISRLRERLALKTVFYIVGTKSDLPRNISDGELQALADSTGCRGYFITSAKNGSGIGDLFSELAKQEPQEKVSQAIPGERKNDSKSNLFIELAALQKAIHELSDTEKGQLLHQETAQLITSLKSGTIDLDHKGTAIQAFHNNCYQHLGLITSSKLKKVAQLITFVAITAIVTVIVAAIGFGIGFAAGAWAGPGAFITGAFSGISAATAVMGVAGTVGGLIGFKGTSTFFKPTPIAVSVNNVCNAIQEYTGNMADIPSFGNLVEEGMPLR